LHLLYCEQPNTEGGEGEGEADDGVLPVDAGAIT